MTAYVKEYGIPNQVGSSNGETALRFFMDAIKEDSLYLLDEPENSLSSKLQLELKAFLEDALRFYGCQFVISTHSPILLSIPGAVIYDLDENPVKNRRWTELENVRIYREFFKNHEKDF